jgi:putative transposase
MQYRRDRTAGATYFFTVVTEQRQPILTLPGNVERLREAFRRERQHHPFTLDAVVVLPDHLHCLMVLPEDDSDYSGRISRIKRYFSVGCDGVSARVSAAKSKKRERPVWQRRFWEHLIRDDDDWRRHIDYLHFNPVKHGVAGSPWDWPYSSLRRSEARGWYERSWGATFPENIREMMVAE